MKWFIFVDEKRLGPLELQEAKKSWDQFRSERPKELYDRFFVWTEGMKDWAKASEHPEFKISLPQNPPELTVSLTPKNPSYSQTSPSIKKIQEDFSLLLDLKSLHPEEEQTNVIDHSKLMWAKARAFRLNLKNSLKKVAFPLGCFSLFIAMAAVGTRKFWPQKTLLAKVSKQITSNSQSGWLYRVPLGKKIGFFLGQFLYRMSVDKNPSFSKFVFQELKSTFEGFPTIPELSSAQQERLKSIVRTPFLGPDGKPNPRLLAFLTNHPEKGIHFYIGHNLPRFSKVRLSLQGYPGAILAYEKVLLTLNLETQQQLIQTEDLHLSSGKSLPQGTYQLSLSAFRAQFSAESELEKPSSKDKDQESSHDSSHELSEDAYLNLPTEALVIQTDSPEIFEHKEKEFLESIEKTVHQEQDYLFSFKNQFAENFAKFFSFAHQILNPEHQTQHTKTRKVQKNHQRMENTSKALHETLEHEFSTLKDLLSPPQYPFFIMSAWVSEAKTCLENAQALETRLHELDPSKPLEEMEHSDLLKKAAEVFEAAQKVLSEWNQEEAKWKDPSHWPLLEKIPTQSLSVSASQH